MISIDITTAQNQTHIYINKCLAHMSNKKKAKAAVQNSHSYMLTG